MIPSTPSGGAFGISTRADWLHRLCEECRISDASTASRRAASRRSARYQKSDLPASCLQAFLNSTQRRGNWCALANSSMVEPDSFPSKERSAAETRFSILNVQSEDSFRSRECSTATRGIPYHSFAVPFGQETVSRNAVSSNASTSCVMPQSNASCPAESSSASCFGKRRRSLPARA
jgi:hypothetical protein